MRRRFLFSSHHTRNEGAPGDMGWSGPGVAALAAVLVCTTPFGGTLDDDYQQWYDNTRQQAQSGRLAWSQFYQLNYDRLTALPPSLQQDARIESTLLLLSIARKYEADELSAPQFTSTRMHLEERLQERLR